MILKDKVPVITGAGQGIGREIALLLSREGARVVVADLNLESASRAAEEIKKMGCLGQALKVDVANSQDVKKMIETVLDNFGKIDILVNNAGIVKDAFFLRMKEEDWDAVLNVNLKGVFLCSQKVAAQMIKQKKGKIVNIASVIGIVGNIGQANYSASKGGVIALTKTLAKELAPRNINVNAVAPGFIATLMTEKIPDKLREKLLNLIPLKRWGNSREIAELVLFLVSEKSNYITGQVIRIDGGMVM